LPLMTWPKFHVALPSSSRILPLICWFLPFMTSFHLPCYVRRSSNFDQSLPSQSLTASSIAPLRVPFLPPSLSTIANRSRRSTPSESTT
jgi:hypothetical protein